MKSMLLDPRIGKLNSGLYYCYPEGHGKPELTGTLEEIEAALGLCPATVVAPEVVAKGARILRVHDVAETVDVVRMIEAVESAE